jgi:predicted Zn-dependent protease
MKRSIFRATALLLLVGGIVMSEIRKPNVPVGPQALLYFIADSQREVTRLPMRITRMSDAEEIRVGNELAANYERSFGKSSDPDDQIVLNYVRTIGLRLASGAHRKLPYQFHYIPERRFVNAFALPGGHIFFGAGLLEFMDSEDELASVLAHEVEHVDHYHCAERVQTEAALRKLPLGELVAIPVELFEAGYTKQQEAEADREGVLLMHSRGYSPTGALRLFEAFDRARQPASRRDSNPQQEIARVAMEGLEGYFRSHPLSSERAAQVRQIIAEQNWKVRAEADLQVRYIVLGWHAEDAFREDKYAVAAQTARNSLQRSPNYEKALQVLAESEFALANFPASAAAYRRLLDFHAADLELGRRYALALSGSHQPVNAVREYEIWLVGTATASPKLKLELAGLKLLAGDSAAAEMALKTLTIDASAEDTDEASARLGYWYYRAGKYKKAAELLSTCLQHRPGVASVQTELGWTLIEENNLEAALQRIPSSLNAESTMGTAVARWKARDQDAALAGFDRAITAAPYWENPRWTNALYSPLVTRSIAEISAEKERRRQAALRKNPARN